jgi:uncharacterized membrane protein
MRIKKIGKHLRSSLKEFVWCLRESFISRILAIVGGSGLMTLSFLVFVYGRFVGHTPLTVVSLAVFVIGGGIIIASVAASIPPKKELRKDAAWECLPDPADGP